MLLMFSIQIIARNGTRSVFWVFLKLFVFLIYPIVVKENADILPVPFEAFLYFKINWICLVCYILLIIHR
jgi:hypothetical protein